MKNTPHERVYTLSEAQTYFFVLTAAVTLVGNSDTVLDKD